MPPRREAVRGNLRSQDQRSRRTDSRTRVRTPGARLLFFSGGSALDGLSRRIKEQTPNSIHLITPFDSGGSSARLRRAFGMLSVGDIRARLLSLADETEPEFESIRTLFSHRLPEAQDKKQLQAELIALWDRTHFLLQQLGNNTFEFVRRQLGVFLRHCPLDFDLRGANVGNLLLVGSYLDKNRQMDAVILEFCEFLKVRGFVYPSCCEDYHLAVRLHSGEHLVGQAKFSGKSSAPLSSPIEDLYFVDDWQGTRRVYANACSQAITWIQSADLICYPMGSFYSSVLCHFLLGGIGAAVAHNPCPKVYVPNVGYDPEQCGMSLSDSVESILRTVERNHPGVARHQILDCVLIDSRHADYALVLDTERVSRLGVQVVDRQLAKTAECLDPDLLSQALLSLC